IDECRISCACSGGQECVNWPGSYQCQGLPELAKIGFEHSLYPVTEDSSSVEICLDVKNSQEPISGWITTNGGAAVTGADYLSIREVVNITDPQESTCYTIPILDDDEFEGNETFSVVLTLNANVSGVQESYDEATVIIVDDDDPTRIGFEYSLYSVAEDSGSVQICLDINSVTNFHGLITTNDGTAVTGADYLSILEIVNTSVSQESTCYTIQILDDDEIEGNETFNVVLTLNANVSSVPIIQDKATVIIVDNDDVDECELEIHNCDVNAECINIIGSYECACNEGYSGDGINCTSRWPIDTLNILVNVMHHI
ncbi:PA14 domain-containing, partial [Paramuricea clavata]